MEHQLDADVEMDDWNHRESYPEGLGL
jgi:hypothetical protein